jgi:RNA polymerase sigma-70 factor (ECF subfamily)
VLADDALAEDITQDLFLRLWNEPDRFDEQRGTLRSFLQRQAHSRSVERVRSEEARRRREDRSLALDVDPLENLESQVMSSIDSDRIRDALSALDADDRRAIVLAYYGGISYREVATRLGLPEGTVKSRIRAGLRRLSSMLDDGGLEAER